MSRLSAIIIGATIALVQPQIAWAQNVYDMVKEITVFIDGCSSGSGVIFNKEGDTYYVLTAYHVVDENPRFCRVITTDGESYDPGPDNIEPIGSLDLAVVKFVSNKRYRTGTLGDSKSITIGKTVYVAGAPPSNLNLEMERTIRVSEGKIIGRADNASEGYTLIYDNTTRGGMSGGPILNGDGEIIGIHGKGDLKDGSKENYGIPIEKFQEARGSRFWQIPSFPEGTDVDESGKVGEGLSWPLILGGGGLAILGGGAGLLWLGYLFGSRTKSQQNAKVIYNPPPKKVPARRPLSRKPGVAKEKTPPTPSRSEPSPPVKQPTILHEKNNVEIVEIIEITPSRSEPSRRVKEPTILDIDHSEVAAQPEEQVPARYHNLRDLQAAGEWKEADFFTAIVMRQVEKNEKQNWLQLRDLLAAGEWKGADFFTAIVMGQVAELEKESWFRYEDIENFPFEDLRAIDKLWVKYSNGRFGFSVQKRIWLEVGGSLDWETECRLADRVGWRVKGEWQNYSDLTFGLAAPAGHLPSCRVSVISPLLGLRFFLDYPLICNRSECEL